MSCEHGYVNWTDCAACVIDELRPAPEPPQPSKSGLTTSQLYALDRACTDLWRFTSSCYLVGTALTGGDYRDVDVRVILPNEKFDQLFPNEAWWGIVCAAIGEQLSRVSGLPVDFQIQRMTEANERHNGPRNPLGMKGARVYAGGGDATPFFRKDSDGG